MLGPKNMTNEWHDVQLSQMAFEEQLSQEQQSQRHSDGDDMHDVAVVSTPPGVSEHEATSSSISAIPKTKAEKSRLRVQDNCSNNHEHDPSSVDDAVANATSADTVRGGKDTLAASTLAPAPRYAVDDATEMVLVELEPTCPPPPRGDKMGAQALRDAAANALLADVRHPLCSVVCSQGDSNADVIEWGVCAGGGNKLYLPPWFVCPVKVTFSQLIYVL